MYAIQRVTHILQAWNSFVSRRNIETLLSSISDLDDILVAINYKINQKLFDNLGHYPIFPGKVSSVCSKIILLVIPCFQQLFPDICIKQQTHQWNSESILKWEYHLLDVFGLFSLFKTLSKIFIFKESKIYIFKLVMFPLVFHCKSGLFENHSTSNIVFSTIISWHMPLATNTWKTLGYSKSKLVS